MQEGNTSWVSHLNVFVGKNSTPTEVEKDTGKHAGLLLAQIKIEVEKYLE